MRKRRMTIGVCVLGSCLVLGACEKPAASTNDGGETDKPAMGHGHDHGDEVDLGTTRIGEMEVTCAQGHGHLEAGKELHITVKLPHTDNGATIVRAWIGTEDRLASVVGKGVYAPSHDDYDIHATAPDPLPEDAKWWIEIERPDGTTSVGSIAAH